MAKTINADELKKNRKNYVLIDVREQEELLGGSIDDSVHLPLGQLIRKVRKTEKDEFGPVSYTHLRAHETLRYLV